MEKCLRSDGRKTLVFAPQFSPASTERCASLLPDHTPTTSVDLGESGGGVVGETAGERRQNIRLEARDLNIFSSLEAWGILGLGQIEGAFFLKDLGPERLRRVLFNEGFRYQSAAYNRLRKLIGAGYISVHRFYGLGQFYGLTEKGHKALKVRGMADLPTFLKKISPFTAYHRILSAGVGLWASLILRLPVVSERWLFFFRKARRKADTRTGKFLLPDIFIAAKDQQKAIEVELHQKSDRRYAELWDLYRRKLREGGSVLYLVPNDARREGLLRLARRFGAEFIYALDIPTIQKNLGCAEFINYRGEICALSGAKSGEETA